MFRLVVLFVVVAVAAAAPGYLHNVPVAPNQYDRYVAQESPEYTAAYSEDAVHSHNAVDLHDVQYDDAHIYEDDVHFYANAHELESKPFAKETVHNIHHDVPEAVVVHNIQQIHHKAPVVVEDAHYATSLSHDVQQLHNLPADTHHLSVQDVHVVDPVVHSVESVESYHAVHQVHDSPVIHSVPVHAVEDAHVHAPVIDDVAVPSVHSVATSNHHAIHQVHGNPVVHSVPVKTAEDTYFVSAPLVPETPVIHNAPRTVIHSVHDVALPFVHSVATSNNHAIHQIHDSPVIHSEPAQTAEDTYFVSTPLVAETPVIHNARRTFIHAVDDVALPSMHSVATSNHHIQQVHGTPVIHSIPAQATEDTYLVSAPLVAETPVIHDGSHTVIHAVKDEALQSVHSIATNNHQSLYQVHNAPVPSFHSLEVAPLVAPPLTTSDIHSESSSSVQHSVSSPGIHVASSHSVHEVRRAPSVLGHAVHAAVPVAVSHSARTDVHETSSVVAAPVVGHLHEVHAW